MGLIGFGGEGRSSPARRWVDELDNLENYPTEVFSWGFYDNQNVDEFFESAFRFISGGAIEPQRIPSSSTKAQVITAILANGRYLFVLDGLEVLQQRRFAKHPYRMTRRMKRGSGMRMCTACCEAMMNI
jgi:hypothetical protein